MRRHRSRAEFHLACPYTSQPICRCRLYVRAEPLRPPARPLSDRAEHVEAVRQNLLGAIMKGNRLPETHSYLSPCFVRAVHRRSLGISTTPGANNNVQRLMAALVDSAEISREDSRVRANLATAEVAEARRIEEARRLREEALRLAEKPNRKMEQVEEEEEPAPVAMPAAQPVPVRTNRLSHLSAEEEARQEELKEIERERARIRKRERDRERRRLKKLQREKDLEAKRRKSSSRRR